MADLLHGWPGPAAAARPPTRVNPLPAKKPSRRAKYGREGDGPEGPTPKVKKPPVVRPRRPSSGEVGG